MRYPVWFAVAEDAAEVALLLHEFNTEFTTPSPGVDFLTGRLDVLLRSLGTVAIMAGRPAIAVALITLRTNVWFDGPVALLDELYVAPTLRGQGIGSAIMDELDRFARANGVELIEINVDEGDVDARRFYDRHGFTSTEPTTNQHALYYFRELPADREGAAGA